MEEMSARFVNIAHEIGVSSVGIGVVGKGLIQGKWRVCCMHDCRHPSHL
jgi:hypothetical protein